eukprot:s10413_g1.t1
MDGDDRKVESASGYASGSGHRLRASACRSPSSRPLVSMLMVFAAFAGHQQIRVFPRAGAADVRPTKPIFQMRFLGSLALRFHAEGAKVITQFLSHEDAKVREAAICALNVISLETRGKKDILQHSLEAIARTGACRASG